MDIGECSSIHDLALRADYEKASHTKDYGYEVDVCSHILSELVFVLVLIITRSFP